MPRSTVPIVSRQTRNHDGWFRHQAAPARSQPLTSGTAESRLLGDRDLTGRRTPAPPAQSQDGGGGSASRLSCAGPRDRSTRSRRARRIASSRFGASASAANSAISACKPCSRGGGRPRATAQLAKASNAATSGCRAQRRASGTLRAARGQNVGSALSPPADPRVMRCPLNTPRGQRTRCPCGNVISQI